MKVIASSSVQEIVGIVARYFRIRANFPGVGLGVQGTGFSDERYRGLFDQLAADVEHSDLLRRLLEGEEPMPYEMWVARQQGVPDLTPGHSVRVPAESSAEAARIMTDIAESPLETWLCVVEDEDEPAWVAFVMAADVAGVLNIASGGDLTNLLDKKLYVSRVADMFQPEVKMTVQLEREGDDQ